MPAAAGGPKLQSAGSYHQRTLRMTFVSRFIGLIIMSAVFAGCAYPPEPEMHRGAGATPRAANARVPSEADRRAPTVPERDRVLFDYRTGITALRSGAYDEAKSRFDDAIVRIGGIITNDAEA